MLQGNTVPMFQYEPCDTASQRWVVWADRFQWNKKPPRQCALLLHMIGEELYSIFKTWKEGEPDVSKNENVYDTAKKQPSHLPLPSKEMRNLRFGSFVNKSRKVERTLILSTQS